MKNNKIFKSIIMSGVLFIGTFSGISSVNAETTQEVNFTPEQQQLLEETNKKYKEEWEEKEKESKSENTVSLASSGMGIVGDILVSYKSSSSASLGGHAAIVVDTNTTVESFGNKGDKNGVRYWDNDWGNVSDARGFRVDGASYYDKADAVEYAESQIGDPYNYNFFNTSTTSKWYCSQLVWKAWLEQGYDTDGFANGIVAPGDFSYSNKVTEI